DGGAKYAKSGSAYDVVCTSGRTPSPLTASTSTLVVCLWLCELAHTIVIGKGTGQSADTDAVPPTGTSMFAAPRWKLLACCVIVPRFALRKFTATSSVTGASPTFT